MNADASLRASLEDDGGRGPGGVKDVSGHSSTPLARKLGIVEDRRVLALSAPEGFTALLEPLPAGVKMVRGAAAFDVAVVFVRSVNGLQERLSKLEPRLVSGARLWVGWPKKSSGVRTDCSFETVQRAGLDLGLVDTKVCAIDETWSGLCFMRRRSDRRHEVVE